MTPGAITALWDMRFNSCIKYYLKIGRITESCSNDWRVAKNAYDVAMSGGDIIIWIVARRTALCHHGKTGDCTSGKIEWSFNRLSICDSSQLEKGKEDNRDEFFSRQCMIELEKRNYRRGKRGPEETPAPDIKESSFDGDVVIVDEPAEEE